MKISFLFAVFLFATSSLIVGPNAAEKVAIPNDEFTYGSQQMANGQKIPRRKVPLAKNATGSAATGNWVTYVKVNPGAWVHWHWHSNPQTVYAVSGTMDYEVKPHKAVKLTAVPYLNCARTCAAQRNVRQQRTVYVLYREPVAE